MNNYLIFYICMAVFTFIFCFHCMEEDGSDKFYRSLLGSVLAGTAWPFWMTLMFLNGVKATIKAKRQQRKRSQ